MTWIVGAPTMFGYGFAISDVRVTLADGREVDCLQKIFAIGRHVAAGFAGSVRIGFAMIDELRRLSDFGDERMACDPQSIAADWPGQARRIFESFGAEERELHCHLMVVCVDPQAHVGNPNWPRSYVHIFRSPHFCAEEIPIHTLGSIGSGIQFEECRAAVESFSADAKRRELFWQGEVGQSGGMATLVGSRLTNILQEARPRGVSAHLHYCWVYRGRTIIQANDHSAFGRWKIHSLGSGINAVDTMTDRELTRTAAIKDGFRFEMPRIAGNWNDLCELLRTAGESESGCVAHSEGLGKGGVA